MSNPIQQDLLSEAYKEYQEAAEKFVEKCNEEPMPFEDWLDETIEY